MKRERLWLVGGSVAMCHHQEEVVSVAEFTGLTDADLLTVSVGNLLPRIERDGRLVVFNPDTTAE